MMDLFCYFDILKVAFGETFQEMEEEGSLPVLLSGY